MAPTAADQAVPRNTWHGLAERIAESSWFRGFIIFVIVVNAISIGISTYDVAPEVRAVLRTAEVVFLSIFVVEMVIRLAAYKFNVIEFCRDPFRCFELGIVAVCFLPVVTSSVTLLRLVRILRITRLIGIMPDAKVLIDGIRRAGPPALSLGAFITLLCFLWAAIGWMFFGHRTPDGMRGYFDNIGEGMLTLFELLTLEGWNQILHDLRSITPWAIVYVIVFLVVGTYVVVNLMVGIIVNSLDDAYKRKDLERDDADLRKTVAELHALLDRIEAKANLEAEADGSEVLSLRRIKEGGDAGRGGDGSDGG
ncbi:hypothetical protein GCM10028820_26260 [Tessaracoccus terricola]